MKIIALILMRISLGLYDAGPFRRTVSGLATSHRIAISGFRAQSTAILRWRAMLQFQTTIRIRFDGRKVRVKGERSEKLIFSLSPPQ